MFHDFPIYFPIKTRLKPSIALPGFFSPPAAHPDPIHCAILGRSYLRMSIVFTPKKIHHMDIDWVCIYIIYVPKKMDIYGVQKNIL